MFHIEAILSVPCASFPVGTHNCLRKKCKSVLCTHEGVFTHPEWMLRCRANIVSGFYEHQNLSLMFVCPRCSTKGNWPNVNHETGEWSGLTVMAAPHKHKWEGAVCREHIQVCTQILCNSCGCEGLYRCETMPETVPRDQWWVENTYSSKSTTSPIKNTIWETYWSKSNNGSS